MEKRKKLRFALVVVCFLLLSIFAGPNFIGAAATTTPDDPKFVDGSQWGLNGVNGINAPEAWGITVGSRNIRVGVIDTGVLANHEDLADNLVTGQNFVSGGTTTNDTDGHGTKAAGVIGGVGNNGKGISGVAQKVSLVPLKVANANNGHLQNGQPRIASIQHATNTWQNAPNNRIRVLNHSVGNFGLTVNLLDAIKEYPGLFVWSAGNETEYVDGFATIAQFDLPNLISVGAITSDSARWAASNYGEAVDIYAPTDTYSTTLYGYDDFGGTSAAAPHVSGVAALMLAVNSNLTGAQLKTAILNNADDITIQIPNPNGSSPEMVPQQVKRLNAHKAVSSVAFQTNNMGNIVTALNFEPTSELVIPDTINGIKITEIGTSVFAGKTGLKSITLPATVQKIGDGAFSGCTNLTTVYMERTAAQGQAPASITALGTNVFNGCNSLNKIYVPNCSVNTYEGATNWSEHSLKIDFKEWDGKKLSGIAHGDGTEKNPFQISTATQLAYLANRISIGNPEFSGADKHFVLTSDVVLNSDNSRADWENWNSSTPNLNSWTPIGNTNNPFKGVFDGNGFAVKGVCVYALADNQGLFGVIDGGTITNIGVEQSRIFGYNGQSQGGSRIGGIAGLIRNSSTITNSYNMGNIKCTDDIGGIVGRVEGNSVITNSYNAGNISNTDTFSNDANLGGIAGFLSGTSTITNSYNIGNISNITGSKSRTPNLGGIVGRVDGNSTVANNYNTGDISNSGAYTYATACLGGITGKVESSSAIINGYNTGEVSNTTVSSYISSYTGGIAGNILGSSMVANTYNTGNISANSYGGGIVGRVAGSSIVVNNYNIGEVSKTGSGSILLGGIIGDVSGTNNGANNTIQYNYFLKAGSVNSNLNFAHVGTVSSENRTFNTAGMLRKEDATADQPISIDGAARSTLLAALNAAVDSGFVSFGGVMPALSFGSYVYWTDETGNNYPEIIKIDRYGLLYTPINNQTEYSVSRGFSINSDIVIPSEYIGKPVTTLKANAFQGFTTLKTAVIPSSVISIGYGAFSGCTNITSLTIPFVGTNSGTSTSNMAGLFGVNSNSNIPKSLATVVVTGGVLLNSSAFRSCNNLKTIVLSSYISTVGQYMFNGCSKLENLVLPPTVTTISSYAFSTCVNLKSIVLPSSINRIETGAFDGCNNLTIYAEPNSRPQVEWDMSLSMLVGYSDYWNSSNRPVSWGTILSPCKTYVVSRGTSNFENYNAPNGISDPFRYGFTWVWPSYWVDNALKDHQFSITLEPDNGDPSSIKTVTYGKQYNYGGSLPTPTKANRTFAGWWTGANGTGNQVFNSDIVLVTSNETILYAKWAQNYTVTYDGNKPDNAVESLTGTTASSTHGFWVYSNLTSNGFELSGWTFYGWNTEADGSGASYWNGQSVSYMTSYFTIMLYAQWCYSIEYDTNLPLGAGNVSGDTPTTTHIYGIAGDLSFNEFSLLGYTFVGWNTESDGSGDPYEDGEEGVIFCPEYGTVTLYAIWVESDTFTVTFEQEGGDGGTTDVIVTLGDPMPAATAPELTDHIFAGYFTQPDGKGVMYYTPQMTGVRNWDIKEDTTLYAKWASEMPVWDGSTATEFSGGSGCYGDPFQISSAEELALLAYLVNNDLSISVDDGISVNEVEAATAHYLLMGDICLNDVYSVTWVFIYFELPWEQVASWGSANNVLNQSGINVWTPIMSFQGHFDGGGHIIRGLFGFYCPQGQGLFGLVTGGSISNVGIEDSFIIGSTNSGSLVGRLYYGSITNCYSTATVRVTANYTGGLIGRVYNGSIITNCYYAGEIVVDNPINNGAYLNVSFIGGIAGSLGGGSVITDSRNGGEIKTGSACGVAHYVGGIAGEADYSEIINCSNTATITAKGETGGIVGLMQGHSTIANCYNTGAIYGNNYIGGIAGVSNNNNKIVNNYSSGTIGNAGYAGAIVGIVINYGGAYIAYNYGNRNLIGANNGFYSSGGHIFDEFGMLVDEYDMPTAVEIGEDPYGNGDNFYYNLLDALNAYVEECVGLDSRLAPDFGVLLYISWCADSSDLPEHYYRNDCDCFYCNYFSDCSECWLCEGACNGNSSSVKSGGGKSTGGYVKTTTKGHALFSFEDYMMCLQARLVELEEYIASLPQDADPMLVELLENIFNHLSSEVNQWLST